MKSEFEKNEWLVAKVAKNMVFRPAQVNFYNRPDTIASSCAREFSRIDTHTWCYESCLRSRVTFENVHHFLLFDTMVY